MQKKSTKRVGKERDALPAKTDFNVARKGRKIGRERERERKRERKGEREREREITLSLSQPN